MVCPVDFTVKQARDAYLADNGFSVEGYDEPWTPVSLFGLNFGIPNTRHHRWAIMLHDLHHVATGYGTTLAGEAEVSAWEMRRGLRPLGLYVGSLVVGITLLGLVIAPRRTVHSFRKAGPGTSLFHQKECTYEWLLGLSVGDLRAKLEVPPQGLAGQAPREGLLKTFLRSASCRSAQ